MHVVALAVSVVAILATLLLHLVRNLRKRRGNLAKTGNELAVEDVQELPLARASKILPPTRMPRRKGLARLRSIGTVWTAVASYTEN